MRDEKFQELVHLYLDGEIHPRDFRRLTRQLARNPVRRAYFLQHCRLHRALSLALKRDERKSVQAEQDEILWKRMAARQRSRRRLPALFSSLAAALILAFFLIPASFFEELAPVDWLEHAMDWRVEATEEVASAESIAPSVTVSTDTISDSRSVSHPMEAEWNIDPWNEDFGAQSWWEFRYPNLNWFSQFVEEDGFAGIYAGDLRVHSFRPEVLRGGN